VLALAANFLLQAHLILRLVDGSWGTFLRAHASGVRLGLLVGMPAAAAASVARNVLGLLPLATIAVTLTLALAALWVSLAAGGGRLLGADGRWLLATLAGLRRRAGPPLPLPESSA
jgi:hypothetical protein